MVCIIGKIGEILGNYQICQNLTFLDNTALVVTPHVKKYMCNHSFLYDHMFPSVCSPIFPSVAHLKPFRIPSIMPICMPIRPQVNNNKVTFCEATTFFYWFIHVPRGLAAYSVSKNAFCYSRLRLKIHQYANEIQEKGHFGLRGRFNSGVFFSRWTSY